MRFSSLSTPELITACLDSDNPAAWDAFVARFHPLITRVVLHTARRWRAADPQICSDLVQETFLKLFSNNGALLRNFEARHADAFQGFIGVVAANVVRDYFKAQYSAKRGARITDSTADEVELKPSSTSAADAEHRVLLHEIEQSVRGQLTGPNAGRDWLIFCLYFRLGLTADAIARVPGVDLTDKGVESTIARLVRMARRQLVEKSLRTQAQPPAERQGRTDAGQPVAGRRPAAPAANPLRAEEG